MAVQGQYAYVPTTTGFLVLDVSNPTNPVPVGSYSDEEDRASYGNDVAVSGNYAYVVDDGTWGPGFVEGSLQVVDVSNPANPIRRGSLHNVSGSDVAVSGNRAYMAGSRQEGTNWVSGLQVIDVSNPANPVRVGSYDTDGRSASAVAVAGNIAYVADGSAVLHVIDVSNPANPVRVGGYDISDITGFTGWAYGVAVAGSHAYLAADGAGMIVIDISDPTNPQPVGGYDDTGYHPRNLAVADDRAYLIGLNTNGGWFTELRILDVSDPTNPVPLGRSDIGFGYPDSGSVAVAENAVFIVSNNWDWMAPDGPGVQIIDVRDPANPVRVGGYNPMVVARDVAVSGSYAYVTDGWTGLQVIDVSDTDKPRRVGGYAPDRWWNEFVSVAVAGSRAYVLTENEGLRILGVSDPANPVRVGRYDTGRRSASGVAVAGNHAYLAETPRWTGSNYVSGGLLVIDVSSPFNPVRVGGIDSSGSAQDVAVAGNHAYLAETPRWTSSTSIGGGLQVIDVSNPASPVRVGGYDTGGSIFGVEVAGNYAYVAGSRQEGTNWIGGIQVVDVSDPAKPVRVGGVDTSGPARDVAVEGQYAYVAQELWNSQVKVSRGRLEVIDVSNPANPVRVGSIDTGGWAEAVTVAGNLIYVAGGRGGLLILEQSRLLWLEVSRASPFSFRLFGEPGTGVRVQRSANLTGWEDWQTVTLGGTPVELSDPNAATTGPRFFRAIRP